MSALRARTGRLRAIRDRLQLEVATNSETVTVDETPDSPSRIRFRDISQANAGDDVPRGGRTTSFLNSLENRSICRAHRRPTTPFSGLESFLSTVGSCTVGSCAHPLVCEGDESLNRIVSASHLHVNRQ